MMRCIHHHRASEWKILRIERLFALNEETELGATGPVPKFANNIPYSGKQDMLLPNTGVTVQVSEGQYAYHRART